ncbi:MAG: GTP-binding protein Obg/CgtA, partial [Deltaproteobacteria bacterium]|nr:GTP-binding protein Obg/CgtA [Deltaproteobacteria bacterium]
ADLPGLIEGAHLGAGLGHRFLKHVERTEGLVHVLDAGQEPDRIVEAYRTIRDEMERFQAGLASRPTLIVFNKMDLTGARENAERALAEIWLPPEGVCFISAATGEGIAPFLDMLLVLGRREPQ